MKTEIIENNCETCGEIIPYHTDKGPKRYSKQRFCSVLCGAVGRKKRTKDHCLNLSKSIKKAWSEGRAKINQNSIEQAKENASKFWTEHGKKKNIEGRKSLKFQETRKKLAKEWHIRSPWNEEFHFKNLYQFIRENPNLFPPESLKPKKGGPCNAISGITRIRGDNPKAMNGWRGWTWITLTEVFQNNGEDLLAR